MCDTSIRGSEYDTVIYDADICMTLASEVQSMTPTDPIDARRRCVSVGPQHQENPQNFLEFFSKIL